MTRLGAEALDLLLDVYGERSRRKSMTNREAIDIAKQSIEGSIEYPESTPIEVERVGCKLIVTFIYQAAPNERAPDYHARVTLDGATGKVVKLLVAS